MNQNEIVEALLAAARGVVAARFGERADELWDSLEFGLRIAAENLVDQAVGRQRRERVRKAYEAFAPISRGAFLPANFPLEVEPSADKPAWFPIVLNSILPPFVLDDFVDESGEEARNQILRTPVNQGDYNEWLRSAGKVNEYERLITGLVGTWSDKKEPYLLQNAMFLLHLLSGEVAKRLDQLRNTTPVKIADDLKKGKWPTHGSEIDRIALRIFLSEKLGREVQETYPLLHEAAEEYERKSANAPSPWAERTADAKRRAEVVNEKVRFLRENAPMVAYDLEELELPSPYLTKAEMDEYEERLKAAEESAFRSARAQPQAQPQPQPQALLRGAAPARPSVQEEVKPAERDDADLVRFAMKVRSVLTAKTGEDAWMRVRPEDLIGWLPDDTEDAEVAADGVLDQGVEPHHVGDEEAQEAQPSPERDDAAERDDADLDIEAGNAPPEAEEPEEPEEPEARPAAGGKRAAKGATGSVSDVREHFGVAAIVRRMGTNQITVQELREAYSAFAARKDEVIEALEALPKVALERYALRKDLPKKRLVESAFGQMLEEYIPQAGFRSFVAGPRMPSRQQVVESTLETATEKDLKEYAERKERNLRSLRERLERLKNPKTYDDFVELIGVLKGSANLSPELRRRFDELVADKAKTDAIAELEKKEKERAERAAKFASARPEGSAATTKAKVIAGRHTKKNTPIWTVVLEERLSSEEFGEAKQRAKRFDGYYSSYRGGGAVPGFVFESEERANAFAATYGGSPAEPKPSPEAAPVVAPEAEREEPRTIYGRKPERLRELAESMAQRANESLGAKRQDNTLRRARMASQAEEAARAELARADTLRAIAEGVESGELQHLWVVGTTAHVDLLDSALLQARHRRYRQERTNEWGDSYESWKERVGPIGEDEMPYVEFPHPQVRKRDAEELARKFAKEKGAIQASARVLKVVDALKENQEVFTPNERTVEALDTLAEIGLQNRETKFTAQNVKERLAASKRASEGMGLRSVNHLRAVLREYLAVRKQPKGQSTVARLKRQIVGADIPGYFPTPPSAAARVVELAKIEPGQLVLEPSAGSGALADAAKAAGGEVRVVERNLSLREILQAKGYPLVGGDTMDVRGAYDRILMNPPFEDSQDIEHVLHAYENQLAPGGRLVAIVSRGALTRSDKKAQGFRDWIASVGAETENLPDGTFASKESERKTGVATSIVIADKPRPGSAQK